MFSDVLRAKYATIYYVTGEGINVFGHLLIKIGEHYFHVDPTHNYPLYMNDGEFKSYMKHYKRTIISTQKIVITDSLALHSRLTELMRKEFRFNLMDNNCFIFISRVIGKGMIAPPPATTSPLAHLGNLVDNILIALGWGMR